MNGSIIILTREERVMVSMEHRLNTIGILYNFKKYKKEKIG